MRVTGSILLLLIGCFAILQTNAQCSDCSSSGDGIGAAESVMIVKVQSVEHDKEKDPPTSVSLCFFFSPFFSPFFSLPCSFGTLDYFWKDVPQRGSNFNRI
jgi:hypothetical protein